jgi:endonuclease-8
MRIVVENSDYIAVGFSVPVARMHTAQSMARDRRIPPSQLDVLSGDFDAPSAVCRVLAHGKEEIADVLLHQEVLAGVGNVFKSEICFVTGVNPFCPVAVLDQAQVAALIAAAQKLVGANVLEDSGDAIVTYRGRRRRTTQQSDPQAYPGAGRACHLLVPALPVHARRLRSGWLICFIRVLAQAKDLLQQVAMIGRVVAGLHGC